MSYYSDHADLVWLLKVCIECFIVTNMVQSHYWKITAVDLKN